MDAVYVKLYKVAAYGDWSTLKHLLDSDPDLITAPITEWKANVIHVAAGLGRDAVFVREVMDYMGQRGISVDRKDNKEQNALHYAARSGNTEAAKLLVEKDPTLTQQQSSFGFIPLQVAIGFGHQETATHLMSVTLSQDTLQVASSTLTNKDDNSKVLPGQHHETSGSESTSACIEQAQLQDAKKELVLKDTKYVKLYKAASAGDWTTGKEMLDSDPDLLTTPISAWKMTVIHMAAASKRGAPFLLELVEYMKETGVTLRATDAMNQNALHYAARSGNIEIARLLVDKDPTLAQELTTEGFTPLQIAAGFNHALMVSYLMPLTISQYPNICTGPAGANLLLLLVLDGFYERAIELLERNPRLALEKDNTRGETALHVLAHRPEEFPSGSRLTFWQRPLYQVYDWMTEGKDILSGGDVENQLCSSKSVCNSLISLGIFRHARERKLKHARVVQLLRILIEKTLECADLTKVNQLLGSPSQAAAREGIHEFVAQVIRAYPFVVTATDVKGRNLFIYAVMHRQHKVFNLLFQLGSWKDLAMGFDKSFNNVLHHAANWSTPARNQIAKIPGAALQMQRELQWYTKVEEVVQPSYRIERAIYKFGNNKEEEEEERKTPQMIFTESHKELLKEGEEWLKGTAESYTIVAALVVTIAFAAAFTVPGGTDGNTGLPIFLLDLSFMVFAISNALAFFSSATSLLMFLGILTSRYSQEDLTSVSKPLKINRYFKVHKLVVNRKDTESDPRRDDK